MSATPITDAMETLRYAVYAALAPLMSAYEDTAGNAKCYWWRADEQDGNGAQINPPYVIFQSQDGGGRAEKRIGSHGWSGLVTVRAVARSQSAAEALYNTVVPGMDALASDFDRPLSTAPDPSGTWQAGGIWRVYID